MPEYGVKIVADDVLPDEVDWAFVKKQDGSMVLVLTRTASGCERALAEAWAAYRSIEADLPVPVAG